MKTSALFLGMSFLALTLTGCFDCEGEMEDTKELWGLPAEVQRYDSEGYHSETWWYWSRG